MQAYTGVYAPFEEQRQRAEHLRLFNGCDGGFVVEPFQGEHGGVGIVVQVEERIGVFCAFGADVLFL